MKAFLCERIRRQAVALLLVTLMAVPEALLAQRYSQPEIPPEPNVGGVSVEQELQLGQQAAAQVYKQFPVLPDNSPASQYVQQLGQKLISTLPQNPWKWNFHVVQEKDINAFALPGGPMFVNLGTITAADNEAQLAGVMAHEMSHVWMRHSAQMAVKQSEAQGIAGVLGALLGNGVAGSLGRLGLSVGAGSLLLKYSRTDESQADAVGAIMMYRAGYDPKSMADFFRKLEQESGGRGPQFLSDHPNPGNREAAIQKEIQEWPPRQFHNNSSQFQQAKSQAATIKSYSAQEIAQGAKTGQWAQQNSHSGSLPKGTPVSDTGTSGAPGPLSGGPMEPLPVNVSSSLRTLEHQGFSVQYPDNWQPYGDAQSPVTIAPQGGISQDSVAYGVLINQYRPQNADSLSSATQELLSSIRQSNPDLRQVGKDQTININGVQGRSVDLLGTSPVQQNGKALQERDWLVAVPTSNGNLLYLVFVAPDKDFGRLRPTYEKMVRSLRVQ